MYRLAFNDTSIPLPETIDDTWKPPAGYYLEGYTDEIHMHRNGDDEPCAGWQFE